MITPELQNYIKESRASGMTDSAIRQNLSTQGWTSSDMDEAMGVSTSPVLPNPSTPSASTSFTPPISTMSSMSSISQPLSASSKKSSSLVKWLLIGLVTVIVSSALVWAGMSAYGIYKLKNISSPMNNFIDNSSQTNNSNSSNSSNVCAIQPDQTALNAFASAAGVNGPSVKWVVTDQYPKEFPTDFPKYPNAKVLVYTSYDSPAQGDRPAGKAFILQTCSTDDLAKVKAHFASISLASSGWQSQREALIANSPPNTSPAIIEQIQAQLELQPLKTFIRGGVSATNKDPKNVMTVNFEKASSINYTFWSQ